MGNLTLLYGACGSMALGIGIFVYGLGSTPPAISPHLGRRGAARQRALRESSVFARLEPLMRLFAAFFARLPLGSARLKTDKELTRAGDYLGLSPDEYWGLSLLGGILGSMIGLVRGDAVLTGLGMMLGLYWPRHKLQSRISQRSKQLSRGLPTSIDLMALCLGAGLDFLGALDQVIKTAPDPDDALVGELRAIRREIALGHTRRAALENFARRVQTQEVRDFVSAVVQAEAKGTPLADVMRVQAEVLRQRRTVKGEESAARASVLMVLPLVLIILSVLALILAPLLLRALAEFEGSGQ